MALPFEKDEDTFYGKAILSVNVFHQLRRKLEDSQNCPGIPKEAFSKRLAE